MPTGVAASLRVAQRRIALDVVEAGVARLTPDRAEGEKQDDERQLDGQHEELRVRHTSKIAEKGRC